LSKEELRQAVLQSFMNIEIKNFSTIYFNGSKHSRIRIGIIRNAKETDIWKLVDQAYLRDKPFNENFSIEELVPRADIQVAYLEEPYIFVSYDYDPNGTAVFYASTEIQPVENPDVRKFRKVFTGFKEPRKEYELSIYKRLSGFGKYYFRFLDAFVDKSCCGNEIPEGWTHERQLKEKENAHHKLMHRDQFTHERFLPISNCGDILTSRSSNSGISLDYPEWLWLDKNSSGDLPPTGVLPGHEWKHQDIPGNAGAGARSARKFGDGASDFPHQGWAEGPG
jgi:hypothetical protein